MLDPSEVFTDMSDHPSAALAVWVTIFSFNRGEFLRHCVASVERCMPFARILIVDDNSTDTQTLAVLGQLRQQYEVLSPSVEPGGLASKHGGLYANMQLALDWLTASYSQTSASPQTTPDQPGLSGEEVVICTLQDDMQVVRPVALEEFHRMQTGWRSSPQRAFLHHAFLKGSERQRNELTPSGEGDVYINQRNNSSVGAWYSDIFIAPLARLHQHGWRFAGRESANEAQARQYFDPMGYLRDPFVAWLPAARCWRGKRRTWAIREGEKRHNCGFHPFHEMSSEEACAFRERPGERLPYAEDYLRLKNDTLRQPWVYHPLQGSRWLKWLNSLELKLVPATGKRSDG